MEFVRQALQKKGPSAAMEPLPKSDDGVREGIYRLVSCPAPPTFSLFAYIGGAGHETIYRYGCDPKRCERELYGPGIYCSPSIVTDIVDGSTTYETDHYSIKITAWSSLINMDPNLSTGVAL